ncbi:hypothetical protein FB565_007365 [Actinoplanes lutulentus]|uniref:VCBS repeat protein n=1 Tax=Actinoplanes lutulentus TaxID=1287878 RepID=A0A327Z0A7_9ACTN|nr:FG-GAP-like repeat-containing protein [Actinoplanes lutulentus]MBB2947594.1 hypothetical protein [Actinoplanes lutulentus]RAK27650.1 VCBS repeat protein [Actinoplanes lutulentus]
MSQLKRWLALAVATVVAVALAPAPASAADTAFRVITYNACGANIGATAPSPSNTSCSYLNTGSSLTAWATQMKSQILLDGGNQAPDVVMFQEMCAGQRDLVKAQLATLGTYGVAWTSNRNHGVCGGWAAGQYAFGTAIFVRNGAATLPVLTEELKPLDPTTPATLRRHLLCTTAGVGGRDSLICDLHTDGANIDEGAPQAMAAMTRWAGTRPIIFGGDLNADPTDPNLNTYYGIEGGAGPFTEVDQGNEPFFDPRCAALFACRSGALTTADRKFDYLFASSNRITWTASKAITPKAGTLTHVPDHYALRGDGIWADEKVRPGAPYVEPPSTGVGGYGVVDSFNWTGVRDATTGRFAGGDTLDDLIVRRWNGDLQLYRNLGSSGLDAPALLRTGVDGKRVVSGDFTGDGSDDLVLLGTTGTVSLFPGDNAGHLGAARTLKTEDFFVGAADITAGDFTGDAIADLAVQWTSGRLFIYPGQADGTLGGSINMSDAGFLSTGAPNGMMAGDIDRDGRTDLVLRRLDGSLISYPGSVDATGKPLLGAEVTLKAASAVRPLFEVVGDLSGDGTDDLAVRWSSDTGKFKVYPSPATGIDPALGADLAVASHGTGFFGATQLSAGDLNGDGRTDLVARWSWGNAEPFLNRGDGTFAKGAMLESAYRWRSVVNVVIGDYTGDGRDDVLLRRPEGTGTVTLHPGTGTGGIGTGVAVAPPAGTVWNDAEEIVGGEFTGDAGDDLVVRRRADGVVTLYPGTGTGGFGAGTVLRPTTNNWLGALSMTVGDFSADGKDDIVVRWTSGRGFLYQGDGNGGIGGSSEHWPIGAVNAAASILPFGGGDIVVKWSDGSTRLYPAGAVSDGYVNVRSFDQHSGVDHFEYAADSATTWTSVPAHLGTGRFRPAADVQQLRIVTVDKAGNRSAETLLDL